MKVVLKGPVKIVPLCVLALFFFTIFFSTYPCFGKVMLYPLYREISKNSFLFTNKHFKAEESMNFRVHYEDSSLEYVGMVIDNAERSLKALSGELGYMPDGKIDIIIYPEYGEMANGIGLGTGSTAMGVYYGGIISILEPEKWIGKRADICEIFYQKGPVLHELTHYIIDYKTRGNIPVWFTEGIALYEEYRVNRVEWAEGAKLKAYYSFEQLQNDFYSLDETSAYKQSFMVVKHIYDNYGAGSIEEITKMLNEGRSINQAFIRAINMDTKELFKEAFYRV